jgi:hypothetical protein
MGHIPTNFTGIAKCSLPKSHLISEAALPFPNQRPEPVPLIYMDFKLRKHLSPDKRSHWNMEIPPFDYVNPRRQLQSAPR